MARTRTMNMSQGRPMKLLALFAIPLLIGNLFQQAYNLADSIIVGQFIGAGALAAVGDTLFSFINGIIEMLCRIFLPMGLMLIPSVGVWAIWWTTGLTWAISAIACLLRYFSWNRKAKAAA